MSEQAKRALVVIRLSRVTDATTSPERQLTECRAVCELRGYEVVGVAEDLDVSGSVDPFDRKRRPQLSSWLRDRGGEFDVIVTYRVDRLTRSIRHLQELVNWADDNGKLIVSATEPHFDTSTPFAAVVIALMGTVAQMELEAISERNRSTAQHNLRAGKYRGGVPPWGYVPMRVDGGWRLVQDAEQVAIISEVVARVLDQEPLQRIAHDLTRRGVLTPKDHTLQRQGKSTRGTAWSVTPLKRSLLSEAMLGYAISSGKPVRNDDGSPVVRADPILTREVFDRLGVELTGRSKRGEPSAASSSLLLRVLHCGVCQLPAYKFNGGSHSQFPRYRCKTMTTAHKCGNGTIRVDQANDDVTGAILGLLGESERLVREWDSGSDNSAELTEINIELTDLVGQIGTPAFRAGTPQRAALDARIGALANRQAALEAEAVTPSGWTWKPTGEKFADWWGRQDTEARNIWLRDSGVRATFAGGRVRLDLSQLRRMTEALDQRGNVANMTELLNTMETEGVGGVEFGPDGVVFHPVGTPPPDGLVIFSLGDSN